MGLLHPVGSERLKACELIAELVHAQYLFISSPLFEYLVQYYQAENAELEGSESSQYLDRAIDGLLSVTEVLVQENVFEITVVLYPRVLIKRIYSFGFNGTIFCIRLYMI